MKNNDTNKTIGQTQLPTARSGYQAAIHSRMAAFAGAAIALLLVTAGAAIAQTTNVLNEYTTNSTTVSASVSNMKILPSVRLTVPISATDSYAGNTITFTLGGAQVNLINSTTNFDGVDYWITNSYDVQPAVATLVATGVPSAGGGSGVAFAADSVTNYNSGNLAASVGVIYNYTNLPSGEYDMAIEVASANTWRFPWPVTVGYKWASTAAAGGTDDGANWVGGVAPGAGDIVIIPDVTFGNATTPSILVTNDTEISALRDIHIGNSTFPNFNIDAGVTLAVTGDGGYRQLNDQLEDANYGYVQASGAGTLLVSNANASFDLYASRQNGQNRFFFDQLDTLKIDVRRIAIDDIWAYPNYGTNGNASRPYRMVATVRLATNNIIRATQTDANNWTDQRRDYSFVIARAQSGGGSGTDFGMRLGNYNEFNCDSVLFGGAGDQCDSGSSQDKEIDFNPSMASAGTKQLIMRGADGVSRMANWTLGDNATPNGNQGSGCKINVLLTGGSIDAMINKLYLARNATNANGANTSGRLDIVAGTLDVNDAYLGYQTGSDAVVGNSTGVGFCQGTINLSGTANLTVNNDLVLGYTEATSASSAFQPQTGYGQLNLSGTAVANINNISAGGVTGATLGNANQKVSITGGTLVLSNSMGSASSPVNTLNISGGGVLALPNLTSTTQTNVYVSNLSGSGGVISLPGLTAGGTYVIASYSGTASITWTLDLPSGYYGFLTIDPGAQLVKAVVTTSPPKTCVWVGYPGTSWDTTSLNWKELVSGNPTNFNQGDAVLFDDSASNATVTVAETVIPAGGTTVTNDTLDYSFSGSNIEGTGGTIKSGTGTLTIANTHLPLVTVDGGSLVVNGTLGGGLTINGASVTNNGTINGAVNLAASGALLDNSGTVTTTPGALSMVSGCTITNESSGTINNGSATDTTYPSGSTFVNKGQINNLVKRISVNGVWISDGGIVTDNTAVDQTTGYAGAGRFTMQTTGELYIRAGGITVEGRFDNILGSRTYINVDKGASPTSQKVLFIYPGDMRGTFVMNNIGATPYANGDTFTVMQQLYSQALTNANAAVNQTPMVSPGAAGVGLQWDTSGMRAQADGNPPASAIRTIAVVNAPTTPPEMTGSYTAGDFVISWASTNISYQLQVQTNDLSTGISNNWVPVAGSENTNQWTIPVDTANGSVFYRLSNQ